MLGAVHKAAFWDCPQLVRVHAVCLNPPVKVLVDYCKFGPLDQFLYRRGTAVTPFHAISICEQISQAVLYLVRGYFISDIWYSIINQHSKISWLAVMTWVTCMATFDVITFSSVTPKEASRSNSATQDWLTSSTLCPLLTRWITSGTEWIFWGHGIIMFCLFRMPWLPPEQQHQSVYADRYALGITIWEVFKLREEPKQYDEMMAEVII